VTCRAVLPMAEARNCWTRILRVGFLRLVQIVSSVSRSPQYCSIAARVWSISSAAIGGSLADLICLMPWYAVAWSRAWSFAPCVRNSLGTSVLGVLLST